MTHSIEEAVYLVRTGSCCSHFGRNRPPGGRTERGAGPPQSDEIRRDKGYLDAVTRSGRCSSSMWGEAPETESGHSPHDAGSAGRLGPCLGGDWAGGVASILPPLSRVAASGWPVVTLRCPPPRRGSPCALRPGMVLAVVVGIPVGILLARSETAGRILRSLGQRFRERPVSALVPLLMAVVASARRPWS